jgi:hypothetical protein
MLNNEDYDLLSGDEKVEIGKNQKISSRSMDEEYEEEESNEDYKTEENSEPS